MKKCSIINGLPLTLQKAIYVFYLNVFSSCHGQLFGSGGCHLTGNRAQPLILVCMGCDRTSDMHKTIVPF